MSLKRLSRPLPSTGGRDSAGRIAVRHRGGGHRRRHLLWDRWGRIKVGTVVPGSLTKPSRVSGLRRLVAREGGGFTWVPATAGVTATEVRGWREPAATRDQGDWCRLGEGLPGQRRHHVERVPGGGAQLACAGGTAIRILTVGADRVVVTRPSGSRRSLSPDCVGIRGVAAGSSVWRVPATQSRGKGKAGRTRWLGRRPTVRGVARNPVDHPHGGGEGKTSGGRPRVSPTSVPIGTKTSNSRVIAKQAKLAKRTARLVA